MCLCGKQFRRGYRRNLKRGLLIEMVGGKVIYFHFNPCVCVSLPTKTHSSVLFTRIAYQELKSTIFVKFLYRDGKENPNLRFVVRGWKVVL